MPRRRVPSSLRRFIRQTLPAMHEAADGRRTLALVRDLVETERWNSFDRFHDATATLTRAYESAGAQVECKAVQTGGRLGSGRWVIHEAADVHSATLAVTSPRRVELADFRANPWHIVQWSAATPVEGLRGELIIIDDDQTLARYGNGKLRGRFILTSLGLFTRIRPLADTGAVVVISDAKVPDRPDAVMWTKFGWGGVPIEHGPTRMVGFALSADQGAELRRMHETDDPLTLEAHADVRRYSGTHDVISGIVAGRDNPQDEIWAMAHTAEPGAVDNASGVAACVEMAHVLQSLIAQGTLAPPRRSIRLINAYECYGFFAYLEQHHRFQPPLAGVNLDGVGLQAQHCDGRIEWHATIPMSAGFVDRAGQAILDGATRLGDAGYRCHYMPFISTCDTLIGDPQYGFPCPWLTTCRKRRPLYEAYHSSIDTPELLSEAGLRTSAAAMAAYVYYLADAGNDELLELADAETQHFTAQLADANGDAARRRYLRDQHRESLDRLERWMWGGDRASIRQHLDALRQQVHDAAGRLRPRRSRVVGSDRVPRRRVLLTPTLENTPGPIAQRMRDARLNNWALFWADGQRSLAQIAEVLSVESGKQVSIEQAAEFFEAHEQLDYVELISPDRMIDKARLVRDLRAIGLHADMDVMVHSSLSRIGHVIGGADTVVDALLSVLGPSGTVLVPSFNHGSAEVFNASATPTTNGAIPDAMWRRPKAMRSDHPTHAVAAIGPKAEHFVADVPDGPFSADSPIGRLVHGGGYLLLIGTTHETTTAMHVAELAMPCGCIDQTGGPKRWVISERGSRLMPTMAWRDGRCPVSGSALHKAMAKRREQRCGKVGHADAALVQASIVYEVRQRQLRNHCPTCPIEPQRGERATK